MNPKLVMTASVVHIYHDGYLLILMQFPPSYQITAEL